MAFIIINRRSRVRAVVTRGSTGLVGQNTSCKAHKVCISVWPMGWDDGRVTILNWQVTKGDGGLVEDLLRLCCMSYNFVLTAEHIEKKLYTDID